MNAESLYPTITSTVGGFFAGIIVGYFLKKIIKIIMFVAGGVVALLLYLQQEQIISVNIEKLEALSTFIITSFASSLDKITHISDVNSLGVPLVGGLSAGFAIGITKG